MRVSLVALLTLASALACSSSGLSPGDKLDGTWEWQFSRNPAGSSINLSLTTAGPTITGTGTICGVGPACSPGSVTISGQHTGNAFQLTIRDQRAFSATYSGQLVGQNELRGTWTHATDSSTVIFYRN